MLELPETYARAREINKYLSGIRVAVAFPPTSPTEMAGIISRREERMDK